MKEFCDPRPQGLKSLQRYVFNLQRRVADLETKLVAPWEEAATDVAVESTSCISIVGNGQASNPIIPSVVISPMGDNQVECTTDGLFVPPPNPNVDGGTFN